MWLLIVLHVWLGSWIPLSSLCNILMFPRCCVGERGTFQTDRRSRGRLSGGGRRWTWPDVPQPPTGCDSQVAPGAMCSSPGDNLFSQLSPPSWLGQSPDLWAPGEVEYRWRKCQLYLLWEDQEGPWGIATAMTYGRHYTPEPCLLCDSPPLLISSPSASAQ